MDLITICSHSEFEIYQKHTKKECCIEESSAVKHTLAGLLVTTSLTLTTTIPYVVFYFMIAPTVGVIQQLSIPYALKFILNAIETHSSIFNPMVIFMYMDAN